MNFLDENDFDDLFNQAKSFIPEKKKPENDLNVCKI